MPGRPKAEALGYRVPAYLMKGGQRCSSNLVAANGLMWSSLPPTQAKLGWGTRPYHWR